MYNADNNNSIDAIIAIDDGLILNISALSENAFVLIRGPARLINTITITVIRNDHPMQIKKGIS